MTGSEKGGRRTVLTREITTAAQRVGDGEKQDSSELAGYPVMSCCGKLLGLHAHPFGGSVAIGKQRDGGTLELRWWRKYGGRQSLPCCGEDGKEKPEQGGPRFGTRRGVGLERTMVWCPSASNAIWNRARGA
jgi:hypothetical protein